MKLFSHEGQHLSRGKLPPKAALPKKEGAVKSAKPSMEPAKAVTSKEDMRKLFEEPQGPVLPAEEESVVSAVEEPTVPVAEEPVAAAVEEPTVSAAEELDAPGVEEPTAADDGATRIMEAVLEKPAAAASDGVRSGSGERKAGPPKPLRYVGYAALIVVLLAVLCGVVGLFADALQDTIALRNQRVGGDSVAADVTPTPTADVEITAAPDGETPEPAETPVPTATPEPVVLEQYAKDAEKNPDMFGWLQIEGTKIDYPVMHTPDDPEKYLYKSFNGIPSASGSLFMDAKCSADSDNLIIYGHNIKNGTMFNSILKYESIDYFNEHPVIRFDTIYEEQEFEVMAAFYDRVYYKSETDVFKFYQFIDAEDQADFDSAVQTLKDKSIYDTGITAEYGDQLIMLVTCAYHTDNGRFVVVARKTA